MAAHTDAAVSSIRRLLPGDVATANAWDAFVFSHPQATFFHRAGWQKLVQDVFKHDTYFLYAQAAGAITGVLPLAHVKTWLFGNALVSLPFAVYGGVVASDAQAALALEHEAQAIAKRLGVAHLELRNVRPVHADWPVQDIYVTFRKTLGPDDDANMLSIPRKQRAMVRKGARNGLASVIDADVNRFYALYADNVRRHGTPALPRRYFQALRAEFGDACEVLTVERADGQPLSSVLSFYFRNEVLPYYAGDDADARTLAANDFKYWELMRRATARGVTVFDYGRSKQGSGSFSFKRNWGFEPSPLHYEYQLYKRSAIPQNNPSNSSFKPLIAVWRRLPLDVTNWLGPYIVRGLG
ncbi:MAG: FemAB family XrtA/PEP-CTERM system-associated protein [Pseudomonadota bacterium]